MAIFVRMWKLRIISVFISLAFLLLQVHNYTPHQHSAQAHVHKDSGEHQHTDQPDDPMQEDELPMAALPHGAGFEKNVLQPRVQQEWAIPLVHLDIDLPVLVPYGLDPGSSPPPVIVPAEISFSLQQFSLPISQRGPPPFFIVAA